LITYQKAGTKEVVPAFFASNLCQKWQQSRDTSPSK